MRLKESELNDSIQEQLGDSKEEVSEENKVELEEDLELLLEEKEPLKEELPKAEEKKEVSSHTMMINDLVKEVQIFSDDEDFIPPKKKGKVFLFILLFLIVIGLGVFLFLHFKPLEKKSSKKTEKESEQTVNHNYRYETEEGSIVFYDNAEKIDTYTCKGECSIYSLGRYQYFSKEEHIIALQDGENIFLYDFVEKKAITEEYIRLENLWKDDKTIAFIASKSTGETGIIGATGEVVVPFEYEDLGYSFGGGDVTDYSYEKNVITALKEGNWGLITLDKGEEKISFQYDDIYFNNYDAICVQKEGLWYLLDLKGEKLLEEGYDMIIPLESYIFASQNNSFFILNYKGEKVVSEAIPTYVKGFRGRSVSEIPTFKLEIDGTVVIIHIMNSQTDDKDYSTYRFNTVNGDLTKVLS